MLTKCTHNRTISTVRSLTWITHLWGIIADDYSAYIADVQYSGKTKYAPAPSPAYKPAPVYKAERSALVSYAPGPAYRPASAYSPAPSYMENPATYSYEYSGVDMNTQKACDGYATKSAYQVLLPDGHTQTVTYNVADDCILEENPNCHCYPNCGDL